MIYACSWPVYQTYSGMTPNYTSIINTCNLWRNFDDIQDSWSSVERTIDYYGDNQVETRETREKSWWHRSHFLSTGRHHRQRWPRTLERP